MKFTTESKVGYLVAERPARAELFEKLGIDFCCGGSRTLSEACRDKSLNVDYVLRLIEKCDEESESALQGEAIDQHCWLDASLTELANHIETTHHVYLKAELPRLVNFANKVAAVHGAKDSRLIKLRDVFRDMSEELLLHTAKEENILFPFIRGLEGHDYSTNAPFPSVSFPIACMEAEHSETAEALKQLSELTDDYTLPPYACSTMAALFSGLAALDADLRRHIHKENSILFPGAARAERNRLPVAK